MPYWNQPLKVAGERVWRAYIGGRELDRLFGRPDPADGHFPEEWMLSVTRARNVGRESMEEGICYLRDVPERVSLKQLIESHPAEMLGAGHVRLHQAAMGVLIKLLDSQEHLTLQVHPTREAAVKYFGSPFGKTESWHILRTRPDCRDEPCIYLGFRKGITREIWKDCFARQDYPAMYRLMNRLAVKPGDTYLVPGGIPHAIGAGCLLLETQEPTDYTVRVERVSPSGFQIDDEMVHQGLGFETMFELFDYNGKTEEEVRAAWQLQPKMETDAPGGSIESLIGYDATEFFCVERVTVRGLLPVDGQGRFSCWFVLEGAGSVESSGSSLPIQRNDELFLPAACEKIELCSSGPEPLRLFRIRGPKN